MGRRASNLQSIILNITIAAYEVKLFPTFKEVDNELQFIGILNDFWDSYSKLTRTRYKIVLPDKGTWGTWDDEIGYTDGVLGLKTVTLANKLYSGAPLVFNDPPGVYTGVVKEETFNILSIASQTSTVNNDLLIKLLIFEPTCLLMYFIMLLTFICICDYLSNDQRVYNLLFRLKFIFFQLVQLTLKQNAIINIRCLFMLLAYLTVALFIAISNAAFNTNAITGITGEQVNHLMDIVRLNKIPVFIEAESMHESFEEGKGNEFESVYNHAKKFGMETEISLSNSEVTKQLTEDNCMNGAIIASGRGIENVLKTIELMCSQASKRRLFAHVSPPFHTTVTLSLINPGTNETIGKELIRRDELFANFVFEGSVWTTNQKTVNYYAKAWMKLAIASFGLKTEWPTQDYPSHVRPLNFSNFALIFKIMISLEMFILLCNVLYQIFIRLFSRVKLIMSVSLV